MPYNLAIHFACLAIRREQLQQRNTQNFIILNNKFFLSFFFFCYLFCIWCVGWESDYKSLNRKESVCIQKYKNSILFNFDLVRLVKISILHIISSSSFFILHFQKNKNQPCFLSFNSKLMQFLVSDNHFKQNYTSNFAFVIRNKWKFFHIHFQQIRKLFPHYTIFLFIILRMP